MVHRAVRADWTGILGAEEGTALNVGWLAPTPTPPPVEALFSVVTHLFPDERSPRWAQGVYVGYVAQRLGEIMGVTSALFPEATPYFCVGIF